MHFEFGLLISVGLVDNVRKFKQFVGRQHLLSVKDEAKLLARACHTEQVIDLDARAESWWRLDVAGREVDDLAHRGDP